MGYSRHCISEHNVVSKEVLEETKKALQMIGEGKILANYFPVKPSSFFLIHPSTLLAKKNQNKNQKSLVFFNLIFYFTTISDLDFFL